MAHVRETDYINRFYAQNKASWKVRFSDKKPSDIFGCLVAQKIPTGKTSSVLGILGWRIQWQDLSNTYTIYIYGIIWQHNAIYSNIEKARLLPTRRHTTNRISRTCCFCICTTWIIRFPLWFENQITFPSTIVQQSGKSEAVDMGPSSSQEPTIATADAGRRYRDGGHLRPHGVLSIPLSRPKRWGRSFLLDTLIHMPSSVHSEPSKICALLLPYQPPAMYIIHTEYMRYMSNLHVGLTHILCRSVKYSSHCLS